MVMVPEPRVPDSNTCNLCNGDLLWFLSGCVLICVDCPINRLLKRLVLYFQLHLTMYFQALIRTPVGDLA